MSKSLPKITIITPSYNQGQFIEQTIKSVVAQKYPNLEYIIMDGGSTDKTLSIIKKYTKKYSYISWQSKKDKGQVDAINQGLKKSTGDIIAYINSDDYYLPNTFTTVARFFQKHPDRFWLVGNCRVTDPKLNWSFAIKHLWPIHKHRFFLEVFNTINQPSVFLSQRLVKKVGFFDQHYSYAFDYDYWLRCLAFSLPARINQNLSVFRIHHDSKGNTGFKKQFTEDFQIAKKHISCRITLCLHWLSWKITNFFYTLLKS